MAEAAGLARVEFSAVESPRICGHLTCASTGVRYAAQAKKLSTRHIFHLSIPVADLDTAGRFYTDVLGATTGRADDDWLDLLVWGHQITLQKRPSDVLPPDRQGKRHFGVILPWSEWESLANRIRGAGISFLAPPSVFLEGTDQEQAKFYVADPSNNIIEIKAYRNLAATVGYMNE